MRRWIGRGVDGMCGDGPKQQRESGYPRQTDEQGNGKSRLYSSRSTNDTRECIFEATAQVLLLDYLRRSGSSEMHGAARSLVADLRNPFLGKMPCELRVSSPTRLAYAFDD